jgi:hypothetical protein
MEDRFPREAGVHLKEVVGELAQPLPESAQRGGFELPAEVRVEINDVPALPGEGACQVLPALEAPVPIVHGVEEDARREAAGGQGIAPGEVPAGGEMGRTAMGEEGEIKPAEVIGPNPLFGGFPSVLRAGRRHSPPA